MGGESDDLFVFEEPYLVQYMGVGVYFLKFYFYYMMDSHGDYVLSGGFDVSL
jgi:hypothetical protein